MRAEERDGERSDNERARLFELTDVRRDNDRRACVRFGIIIGQTRHRAPWRRENLELF